MTFSVFTWSVNRIQNILLLKQYCSTVFFVSKLIFVFLSTLLCFWKATFFCQMRLRILVLYFYVPDIQTSVLDNDISNLYLASWDFPLVDDHAFCLLELMLWSFLLLSFTTLSRKSCSFLWWSPSTLLYVHIILRLHPQIINPGRTFNFLS